MRDSLNVVVALTVYGIALMARSTADGLASVDADVKQSASAVGFSSRARFWRVELPLAAVLLAGLRVVAVSTISLTTVGAVLGIDSLGALFTDGFQRNIPEEIAAGIVLTIAMALVVDLLLVLCGRALMPWTRPEHVRAWVPEARLWHELLPCFIQWILDSAHYGGANGIDTRVIEHLIIVLEVVLVASLIAVPLGYLVGHTGRGRALTMSHCPCAPCPPLDS